MTDETAGTPRIHSVTSHRHVTLDETHFAFWLDSTGSIHFQVRTGNAIVFITTAPGDVDELVDELGTLLSQAAGYGPPDPGA